MSSRSRLRSWDVMVPHFFQANETVNKTVYLDVLKRVVVPWMKKTAGERKYTFQQDSSPAHKAKTVQNYLEANTAHFWSPTFWPANSPDLNPVTSTCGEGSRG
ncbi:Uncharacterized protein FKW44_012778 [Caligus rogercresseyi]|uniref:Tc1-like transposase DDE domain-containing protein n=1 Tax=Caligus rogercresseyi TaxID=217165 RepID=A0A7T8HKG2_CALRO|nr:Uncharacterized protein FKW44_012778 [Caligus rogercresseyi]